MKVFAWKSRLHLKIHEAGPPLGKLGQGTVTTFIWSDKQYMLGIHAWFSVRFSGCTCVVHGVRRRRRAAEIYRVGVAKGGVAPTPARHAVKREAARAGGGDPQEQAGDHVVPDVVALGAGLGGADAPGEGGFGLVAYDRGSSFGPRGWAVV